MGKEYQGVFGNWSGKVGNVVGRIREGRTVLAIYQPIVSNPQTVAQQSARLKFRLLSKVFSTCLSGIQVGFKKLDGYKMGSAYSSAVGYNLKKTPSVFSGTYPNISVAYNNLSVAEGTVELPFNPSASIDGGEVQCSWSDNTGLGNAKADDKMCFLMFNPAKNQAIYVEQGIRSDRNAAFTVPTAWTGDAAETWLFCMRPENDEASNSFYLGSLNI